MNWKKFLIPTAIITLLFPITSAFAKGEVSLEYPDRDADNYEGVEIHDTPSSLYFRDAEGTSTVIVDKNQCTKEGELIFCDKARVSIENDGVIEEIVFTELVLFINNTATKQQIKGSLLVLKPQTVLLEGVTKKGTFITAYGKIDSNKPPVEE